MHSILGIKSPFKALVYLGKEPLKMRFFKDVEIPTNIIFKLNDSFVIFSFICYLALHLKLEKYIILIKIWGQLPMVSYNNRLLTIREVLLFDFSGQRIETEPH